MFSLPRASQNLTHVYSKKRYLPIHGLRRRFFPRGSFGQFLQKRGRCAACRQDKFLFRPRYAHIKKAARTVKVTAQISSGFTPFSASRAMRSVSVNVFPVPGPAITAVTRASLSIAASCAALIFLSALFAPSFETLSALICTEGALFSFGSAAGRTSDTAISLKKESCPLEVFSSSGVNSAILPYSPSNPAVFKTRP